jgi:hypothetical protein
MGADSPPDIASIVDPCRRLPPQAHANFHRFLDSDDPARQRSSGVS